MSPTDIQALIAEARALQRRDGESNIDFSIRVAGYLSALADTLESVAKERDAHEGRWKTAVEVVNEYRERAWKAEDANVALTLDRDALLKFLHSIKQPLESIEDGDYLCSCTGDDDHRDDCPRIKARAAVNLINQELHKYEK